jgi:RNase H-fold protein (predicted Holliday junction resolvase)
MVIMAIDASTKSTGVALFEDDKLIDYSLITAGSTDLIKRIKVIVKGLEDILKANKVDKIVLEEVRPRGGTANVKT